VVATLEHQRELRLHGEQLERERAERIVVEREATERILVVSIEAGGHEQEIGREALERRADDAAKQREVLGAVRVRWDRDVHRGANPRATTDVDARTSARVLRPFVHRGVEDIRVFVEDGLGAITVMHVPVEDRDTEAARLRGRSSDGDVVDEAEAHRAIGGGVVSRRTHERERGVEPTVEDSKCAVDRAAGREERSVVAAGRVVGVGIEPTGLAIRDRDLERVEVARRVHALELGASGESSGDGDRPRAEATTIELGVDRGEAPRVLGVAGHTKCARLGIAGGNMLGETRIDAEANLHAGILARRSGGAPSSLTWFLPWFALGLGLSSIYLAVWPAEVNGDGIGYLKAARAGVRYPGHLAYVPLLSAIWRFCQALRGAAATGLQTGVLPGRILSALAAGTCAAVLGAIVELRTGERRRGLCAALGLAVASGFVLVATDLESYAPALLALTSTLLFLELDRPTLAGLMLAAAALFHIENALFFLPAIAYCKRCRGLLVVIAASVAGLSLVLFAPPGGALAATHGFHYPLHFYTPFVAVWGALRAFVYVPYLYEAPLVQVVVCTLLGIVAIAALAVVSVAGSLAGRSVGLPYAVALTWLLPYATVGMLFFPSDSERWLFLLPLAWMIAAQLAQPRHLAILIVFLLACDVGLWLPHAGDHHASDRARAVAATLVPGELVISPGHGWDESIALYVDIVPFPLVFHAAARGGAAGLVVALDSAIAAAKVRHAAVRIVRVYDTDDPSGTLGYKELETFGIDRKMIIAILKERGLVTPP